MRIVSFSLYGSDPLYTVGAIENAKLIESVYPGWAARFYVDRTAPAEVVAELQNLGSQIVDVTEPSRGPMYGRHWRSWVACEPDVEYFIVRDVDSRLNQREKTAVDQWIASGRRFHFMRDSFYHSRRALGGMWGAQGNAVPNIRELVGAWDKFTEPGQHDQFMSEIIYPLAGDDLICHDDIGHFPDAIPFPSHEPLNGTSFVGEKVHPARQIDAWRRIGELQDRLLRLERQQAEGAHALKVSQAELAPAKERIAWLEQRLETTQNFADHVQAEFTRQAAQLHEIYNERNELREINHRLSVELQEAKQQASEQAQ